MNRHIPARHELARFDSLPFPARTTAVARYARALDEPGYRALRAALDRRADPEDRHLGFFLAVARRDLPALAAALDDPLLRRRALSAAIRLPVPDEALERSALSPSRAVRHDTFRALRLGRRRRLAERLLPEVARRHGDEEAARLLPACAPGVVERVLPGTDPPPGLLAALARTAPRAVAAHLAAVRTASPQGAAAVRRRVAPVVSTLAERDPRAALTLLEHAPDLLTPRAARALLRLPRQTAAVLGGIPDARLAIGPEPLSRSLVRALRGLSPQELLPLARACVSRARRPWSSDPTAPDPLLALLPAPDRRRVVEPLLAESGAVPPHALAALAPGDRVELARPALDPRRLRQGAPRYWLMAVLPLASGEPPLRAAAGGHRVEERAAAWPALLASARLEGDPAAFARIVASCERAWHDQDMVRVAVLRQLSCCPPGLLSAVPYAALRDAALTTTQSRDSTPATIGAAERWLLRTARTAAARGAAGRAAAVALLLAQLVTDPRRQGSPAVLRVDPPAAAAIWAAAGPSAPRPGILLALAGLLAPHLAALPELDRAVRRLATEADDPVLAGQAAGLWLRDPATREDRCAELLAVDPEFAALPQVLAIAATRRTDLLGTVLDGLSGGSRRIARTVPRLPYRVTGRWLPAQRAAFAGHLVAIATDEDAPLRERADAASLLRDPAALVRLTGEAPQPVAAAALTALGEWAAGPHGETGDIGTARVLELLLGQAAIGGVRGRAAMAGLRGLLATLPDGEVVDRLAPVAVDREAPVGIRKEAARALAAVPGDRAHAAVLAAWDADGQHRDVLAALAGPLVGRIHLPGIAERLTSRAGLPAVRDVAVGVIVDLVPAAARPAYRRFLVDLVCEADAATARAAATVLLRAPGAVAEPLAGRLARALTDRERPAAARRAAGLVIAGAPVFRDALGELVAAAGRGDGELIEVVALLDFLQNRCQDRAGHEALTGAFLALGLPGAAAGSAWRVLVGTVRRGRLGTAVVARVLPLLAGCPSVISLDPLFTGPGAGSGAFLTVLPAVLASLRDDPGEAAGLLRIALVVTACDRTRWADPWPAELATLRGHPVAGVAQAALLAQARRHR